MNIIGRAFLQTHVGLYRLTGGAIGGKFGKNHMILLTTTGRKTGKARTIPLAFIEDDAGNPVVTASYGGAPQHPIWFENLKANSEVTYQIDGKVTRARAEIAPPQVREALWKKLTATHTNFLDYQKKTDRVIPMVVLRAVG